MKTRLTFVAFAVLAMGCDDKKEPATPPAIAAKADPVAPKPAVAETGFKANPQVMELLKRIAEGCTVSIDSPAVYSCKDKEDSALNTFIDGKPTDLYETYASLLDSADMKMRAIAIAEANNALFIMDPAARKTNATRAVATAFLDALAKNDDYAVQLSQPAVALGFDAGLKDQVIKVTDGIQQNARTRAYMKFLQYGRLDALPRIQELAKEKDFAVTALTTPRYLVDWTAEEKAQICPWAKGYLADADLHTAAEAGFTMIQCEGEFIDALLDEGDRRLKAKQYDDPFADSIGQICSRFTFMPQIETDAQCKRDFAFLEKAANDASLKPDLRATSLWNIYSMRRNKETLPVLKKFTKSKVPELSKKAKEALAALAQNNIK